MKHLKFAILGLAVIFAWGAGRTVYAQGPYNRPIVNNPYLRPAYSPYLNLNRPGGNAAQNYFGLVQPQEFALNSFQQLQQQNQLIQRSIYDIGDVNNALITGNRGQFMNYGRYFLNNNGPGAGGAGGFNTYGGGGAAARAGGAGRR